MQRKRTPAQAAKQMIPTPALLRRHSAEQRRRLLVDAIITLLLILASFTFYARGIDTDVTPFHKDESRWINRGHYLPDLLQPFGPTWNDQYLTRGQPPVGSYMIGLGMLLQERDFNANRPYDFRRSWDFNTRNGMFPNHGDLLAARRWNSVLGAIACGLVYLIVRSLTNPIGGIVGALFLLGDPLQTWHNRLALADTTLTLTLALLFMVVVRLMRKPSWVWAIIAGILIGLGGANKFTPLALSIPLAGIGLFLLFRSWQFRRSLKSRITPGPFGLPPFRDLSWMLLSTPLTALMTFVIVYPYLWPAPIDRTLKLLSFRRAEMANQYRLNERFRVDSPIMGLKKSAQALADSDYWSATSNMLNGIGLDSLGRVLSPLDLVLGVLGLILLCYIGFKKGIRSAELVLAAVIIFQAATIIFSMKVAFERYYLPMVLGEMIALGCAVGYLTEGLMSRWRRSPRPESPAAARLP